MAFHHRFSKRVSKKFVTYSLVIVLAVFVASVRWTQRGNCSFKIEGSCVVLERVEDSKALQLGLSNRERLAKSHGMLFVFPDKNEHCMWMKDMRFSLDMMWLEQDGTISKIVPNVSPETVPQSYCGLGRYVIEVNAGVAQGSGLLVGSRIKL